MPKRDYASRSKTKKQSNKLLILIAIALLLLLSGLGLWMLQEKAPPQPNLQLKKRETQKSELPSRPEEIYSYIRDLETREISVNENSKFARLSKEQEQEILRKQAEEKKKLAQPSTEKSQITTNLAPSAESIVQTKQAPQKTVEAKSQKELNKAPETAPKTAVGKYGLQCGAFKNKAQAENMQARLAMAGYNARVSTNAGWNRVFVGPLGDRSTALNAQSNAKSVAECLVVAM